LSRPLDRDTFAHTHGKDRERHHRDHAQRSLRTAQGSIGLIRDSVAQGLPVFDPWPRVFPEGTGAPGTRGSDFYDRLVANS